MGTEFEQLWADGKVLGWENKGSEDGLIQSQEAVIDLDYYSSVEELMEVGPEKLKEVSFFPSPIYCTMFSGLIRLSLQFSYNFAL